MFGEIGQKVGPEVGFPLRLYSKTQLPDLLFDLFLEFTRNLVLSYFIFSGISDLVAHRAVTKKVNDFAPTSFLQQSAALVYFAHFRFRHLSLSISP